jgi:hypothetical protein
MFAGFEVSKRDMEVPQLGSQEFRWREENAQIHFYKAIATDAEPAGATDWELAVSLDAEYETVKRSAAFSGAEGILELRSYRAPLTVRAFSASGFTLRATATYVRQKGEFAAQLGDPVVDKDDDAVIADLVVEYRLPGRLGAVAIGANNVFDEFVDLVEIDPLNPRVATRRLVFAKIRVEF